jgi:16S rRNA (guanine966-N2)-methyltransferase
MPKGKNTPTGPRNGHRRGARSRELRIIAGVWRGRRLRFADAPEIRPTPDRVRETLFNWLGPRIAGARCLDLFAGSGALGLEALSRGAAHVLFVERNAVAARELRTLLEEWRGTDGRVQHDDALRWLSGPSEIFDIVFLDPPFSAGLLEESAARLEKCGWLGPRALIYVEAAAREPLPALPSAWQLLKAKRAGEVGYHLFERSAAQGHPSK